MLRGIVTVGGWTMASRVLGFVRDMLFAAVLGAGPVADAFFVALKLPNLFRRLFGEGAFNAAFVPDFAGLLATEGPEAARRFASEAFAVLAFWLLLLTVLGEVFMPQLMVVLAAGWSDEPTKLALAVTLSRITFPYLLLICLAALLSGVLNGLGRFAAAAAAPVLYNVIAIAFMVWLTGYVPTAGHAFAIAVSVSGVAQLALLLLAVRRAGMRLSLPRPRLTPRMRVLLRRMVPGLIGAGVTQINQMVDVLVQSLLPAGTVSVLYYANQVQQLPLAVIGTAVGTAMLPLLSRQVRSGEDEAAAHTMNRALEYALFLTLPAAVALAVAAEPVTATLFGRGAFGRASIALSAGCLSAYALGLPAFVAVKVLSPGFFARGDTATPVRVGVVTVGLNLALNLALMGPLQSRGPALASSLAACFNTACLALLLARRGQLAPDAQLARRLPRIAIASALMGVVLWAAERAVWPPLDHPGLSRWIGLALLVGLGLAAYFAAAAALGAWDARGVAGRVLRRRPLAAPP